MNNYKSITNYLKNGIINLSRKQLKRNIKKIYKEGNDAVLLLKNKRGVLEWHVDCTRIHLVDRSRKAKKSNKEHCLEINGAENYDIKYKTSITINFKENYDSKYYSTIANFFNQIYRHSLYYVIEKDENGYNHIHIGCTGAIEVIKIQLRELLHDYLGYDELNFNTERLFDNASYSPVLIEKIFRDSAHQQYLKKGNDGLGGVRLVYLD